MKLFRSKKKSRAEMRGRAERMGHIMAIMRAHEELGALANSEELRKRLEHLEALSDAKQAEFLSRLEAWVPERFMGIK